MTPPQSRIPTVLATLVALPLLVLGVGFLFHTDFEPSVLGKYSGGYFAFLLAWWLVLVPLAFLGTRFVLRTQRIELSTGTVWHVRPSLKILLCLLFFWGANRVVQRQLRSRTDEGVSTPMRSDEFHPYLQNVMRPSRASFGTNRWGFRGEEIDKKKRPGVYRIFALGGSTTASLPLERASTYPELLAARLRETHPGITIEVQNAAGEWHTTQHSLIKLLTEIRSFEPDLVLCYHAINDLGRSFTPDLFARGPYREDYRHYLGPVSMLAQPGRSRWPILQIRLGYWFSDFRMQRVRILGPDGDGVKGMHMAFFPQAEDVRVDTWPSLGAFRRNLDDLCEVCRDAGIELVLASQPFLYRADLDADERALLWTAAAHQWDGKQASLASLQQGMESFNTAAAGVAHERGVSFVDLAGAVPKTTEFFYDDVHYTARACDVIAGAFFDEIEAGGLIPASPARAHGNK